jgi:hypothetical protein
MTTNKFPAWAKQLEAGDLIMKVAQEMECIDVVGMRLDDVKKKIERPGLKFVLPLKKSMQLKSFDN